MADKPAAAGEEGFNFGAYMKERAVLVNEALDRSVPLQYPEVIHESMRCGGAQSNCLFHISVMSAVMGSPAPWQRAQAGQLVSSFSAPPVGCPPVFFGKSPV